VTSGPIDGAPAIELRGLTKRFGSVLALDHVDLEVPEGVVFGLLGPNGAGKTTAIRLLTGVATPTAGSATVRGVDVRSPAGIEARGRIGVLDQEPKFYGWMTGRELLAFVADLLGLERSERTDRIDETLERIGLSDAADRRISGYSGGMRQRLGIGQAIVGRPEILILDEPVSSLDPEGRRDLLRLIGELRESATVILSSHVLSDVERVCDQVAILDRGRVVAEAAIDELLDRYAPPVYRVEAAATANGRLDRLATELEQQAWVSGAEVDGEHLNVSVSDDAAASSQLLPLLAASGVPIVAFERARPTLEDVFLRLVGHDDGREVEDVEERRTEAG
jgi:ABC-2 type transport system ATP-binding protein